MRRLGLTALLSAMLCGTSPNWRLTGRYTHDNSFTEEPGGLFILTTCNPSNDSFGQILNSRAAREIQLGLSSTGSACRRRNRAMRRLFVLEGFAAKTR